MKHLSLQGSAIAVGLALGLAVVPSTAYAQDIDIACGDTNGLINAINTLNGGSGGTIALAEKCTYAYNNPFNTTENALPVITTKITITGRDSAIVRAAREGGPRFRLLQVAQSGDLTLHGIEVMGGDVSSNGGGIANQGKLTLDDSEVTGNAADGQFSEGGGVLNDEGATVTIRNSSVSNNAAFGAGGLSNAGTATVKHSKFEGNFAFSEAGGIDNTGDATISIEDSVIAHNTGRDDDGGGIINAGKAKLKDTVVSDNFAGLEGGGINNSDEATLEITGGEIKKNNAGRDGGAINNEAAATLTKVKVEENSAGRDGGGINNESPDQRPVSLTLHDSTVVGNTAAGKGGGINKQANSTVTLDDSKVIKNRPNNCFPLNGVTGCQN